MASQPLPAPLMASNSFTRTTISGQTQHTRKGTQGRPKVFGDKYGQRLFKEDDAKIKELRLEKNDLVRLAVHKFLLDNYGHTELVKQ